MTARVWADGCASEAAHENDQAGDLGSVIVEYCGNLWVELEVAVGCLRWMSCWVPILQLQYFQWTMMYRMMEVTQKKLNE